MINCCHEIKSKKQAFTFMQYILAILRSLVNDTFGLKYKRPCYCINHVFNSALPFLRLILIVATLNITRNIKLSVAFSPIKPSFRLFIATLKKK